jgi:hypothetical protein
MKSTWRRALAQRYKKGVAAEAFQCWILKVKADRI